MYKDQPDFYYGLLKKHSQLTPLWMSQAHCCSSGGGGGGHYFILETFATL
jgi:hypothetical protein